MHPFTTNNGKNQHYNNLATCLSPCMQQKKKHYTPQPNVALGYYWLYLQTKTPNCQQLATKPTIAILIHGSTYKHIHGIQCQNLNPLTTFI
jgi:hypothetical protein